MQSTSDSFDKKFWAISLIIGQVLFIMTTFLWKGNSRYSINASTFMYFSMLFWTIGLVGLFDLVKHKFPIYARLGLLYATYGTLGGVAFAFEGIYSDIFKISDKIGVEAAKVYPLQMNLVLFWSGPAFPLSMLVLGIVLSRTKIVNWWVGTLLSLGGISFPIGRILRTEWVAHLTDFILFIPICIIAYKFWNETQEK